MSNYDKCKVYHDGSHFVCIPFYKRRLHRVVYQDDVVNVPVDGKDVNMTKKEYFNKLYDDVRGMCKSDKVQTIIQKMSPYFEKESDCFDFVNENFSRVSRNLSERQKRLVRKCNMNNFNYFCTFTYSDDKMTADEFRKKITTYLRNKAFRSDWKYIAVFEFSPKENRLHLHALVNIPDNTFSGSLEEIKDYSTKNNRMQVRHQDSHIYKMFGVNDFKKLSDEKSRGAAVGYLRKYIEKSGEKFIYSRGLFQYIEVDVLSCQDTICHYGNGDSKLVLYDDFIVISNGKYFGSFDESFLDKVKKVN